jgi:Helix-turn-helix
MLDFIRFRSPDAQDDLPASRLVLASPGTTSASDPHAVSVVDLRALIEENADLKVALCDARIQLLQWKEFAQAMATRRRALGRVGRRPALPPEPGQQPAPRGRNERLRLAIAAAGYSPRTFARAIDVHPDTVERWISGRGIPRRDSAYRAARLLGLPVPWLIPALDADTR